MKAVEPQKINEVLKEMVPVCAHCFCFANRRDSTQCYLHTLVEQGDGSLMSPAERAAKQSSCMELPERQGKKVGCSAWPGAASRQLQAGKFRCRNLKFCGLYSWGTAYAKLPSTSLLHACCSAVVALDSVLVYTRGKIAFYFRV